MWRRSHVHAKTATNSLVSAGVPGQTITKHGLQVCMQPHTNAVLKASKPLQQGQLSDSLGQQGLDRPCQEPGSRPSVRFMGIRTAAATNCALGTQISKRCVAVHSWYGDTIRMWLEMPAQRPVRGSVCMQQCACPVMRDPAS